MKLLSWGANTYSQLGLGVASEQCVLPLDVVCENNSFDPGNLCCIVGGGGHTMLLDRCGHVFGCGWNSKGQLALPLDSATTTIQPVDVLKKHHVVEIACGWDSSFAVTQNGELLVWGSNSFGQLGIPVGKLKNAAEPLVASISNVWKVSAGLRHAAILRKDGRLFVCGDGKKGQLGLVDGTGCPLKQVEFPKEVPGLSNISAVSCGQHHTVALSSSGDLFVWGDNKYGQLGLDPALHPTVPTPRQLGKQEHGGQSFSEVLCGWTHVAALTESQKVVNWGRNTYGQLGCQDFRRSATWKPEELQEIPLVKQLCVGSEHNLALSVDGELFSWGWNEHGNCGVGTEEDVLEPMAVGFSPREHVIMIGTGAGHSFAVVS